MSKSIKIVVACHYDSYVPKLSFFVPVQTGVANAPKKFDGMLYDNEGDNLSEKNDLYCELTAQYWAWKNLKADYYGCFHHRRYLNFSKTVYPEDGWGNIAYHRQLDNSILEELEINESTAELIEKYDAIVPRRRVLPENEVSIYKQYCGGPGQHKEDLDCAISVISERYPEYKQTAIDYLQSNCSYDCNMYILKADLFNDYMSFLFDILFEVEKRRDFSLYNMNETRVLGFLAERLFGIWFVYNSYARKLKTLELQKTLFYKTEKPLETIKTNPKSVVVVLSASDLYVPYLGTMLQSIVQNTSSTRQYEIYVLTTSITTEHIEMLKKTVVIDNRFLFKCINVSSIFGSKEFYTNYHIGKETYYRLIIPLLFSNTNKVLYLDSDMIVNADVAELFDTNITGSYLAAIKDIDIAGQLYNNYRLKNYLEEDVAISNVYNYFQAGCLLLNLSEIRKKYSSSDLIRVATNRQWTYLDQDVLNHLFNDKVVYLNQCWNTMMDWREQNSSRMAILKKAPFTLYNEYLEARKSPKIVHYAGYQKPWNVPTCDFAEYFWKYARQTVFYEEILARLSECRARKIIDMQSINPRIDNIGLRVSEIESWNLNPRTDAIERNIKSRRYLLKRIIGEGRFGKIVRKIWRLIKK